MVYDRKKVIDEAKRIAEDCNYSSKGHFYAGQRWSTVNFRLGGISCILASIAAGLSVFNPPALLLIIISIIVAAITAIMTFINPSQLASQHNKDGNKYLSLRNDSRIFYSMEVISCDDKEAIKKLKKLNDRRNRLNSESCQIPKWAFEKAREGIEEGESEYEIDKL